MWSSISNFDNNSFIWQFKKTKKKKSVYKSGLVQLVSLQSFK